VEHDFEELKVWYNSTMEKVLAYKSHESNAWSMQNKAHKATGVYPSEENPKEATMDMI
jgi:hypothetical protein